MDHVRDYVTLSDCYDLFNERLFDGALRGCVLTFEDRGQHFGYYREGGFIGRDGERRDEICLNPQFFLASTGDLELLQTLVHEQVHQWQQQFGTASRRTYHNREWANKMLSVGLIPSTTGKPGGGMVGQKMADYPQEGGRFLQIAGEILASKELIRWYKEGTVIRRAQEYAAMPGGEEIPAMIAALAATLPPAAETDAKPEAAPTKVGYRCPGCKARVWGKPNLSLICGKCYEAGDVVYLAVISTYLQATGSWVSARPV